jgi:hypothetical protein
VEATKEHDPVQVSQATMPLGEDAEDPVERDESPPAAGQWALTRSVALRGDF